jgi:TRAP-type uncharacterized transport system fused permease subunit
MFGEERMNMKDYLDDGPFQKRQRIELILEWLFCILSVGFLCFIIVEDLSALLTLVGITMSFVIGAMSLMYGFSRRHRRDHKQLHDMLLKLNAQKDTEQGGGHVR